MELIWNMCEKWLWDTYNSAFSLTFSITLPCTMKKAKLCLQPNFFHLEKEKNFLQSTWPLSPLCIIHGPGTNTFKFGGSVEHFKERGKPCSPALLGASQLLSGCFNIHDKLESQGRNTALCQYSCSTERPDIYNVTKHKKHCEMMLALLGYTQTDTLQSEHTVPCPHP